MPLFRGRRYGEVDYFVGGELFTQFRQAVAEVLEPGRWRPVTIPFRARRHVLDSNGKTAQLVEGVDVDEQGQAHRGLEALQLVKLLGEGNKVAHAVLQAHTDDPRVGRAGAEPVVVGYSPGPGTAGDFSESSKCC